MTEQDDLRYPIGRFRPPAASTPGIRAAQIETLRLLPERLRAAVAGLSDAQLDTPYREGGWTVRQVVHHLADSHANAYVRFKLALTEDWPTIKPYDEAAWARLPDSRLPIEPLAGLHRRAARASGRASRGDVGRGFPARLQPSRTRAHDLATNLAIYEWHSRHHTAHITSLRARMGW